MTERKGKKASDWKRAGQRQRNINQVEVAVYGDDRGTREAMQHRGIDIITDPTGESKRDVARAHGVLDRWLSSGQISAEAYQIGLEFQSIYHMSGKGSVPVSNYSPVPGGGMRPGNNFIEVLCHNNKKLRNMIMVAGGIESPASRALCDILGEGASLTQMAAGGGHKLFWSGVLTAALEILADARKNKKL